MTHPLLLVLDDLTREARTLVGDGNERTNDRLERQVSGNHHAPLPISTHRVDVEQHATRTTAALLGLLHAENTGEGDWQVPPWLGIVCPGSCERVGSLYVDTTGRDNPDLPVYCRDSGCYDDRGIRTRRTLKWLEGQGDKLHDSDEPQTMLDRLKAIVAEKDRMLEASDRRTEHYRQEVELLRIALNEALTQHPAPPPVLTNRAGEAA